VKIDELSYEILRPDDWSTMLRAIEVAGRNCYKSEDRITDESAKKFVAMLIRRGHEAMLEHAPNISVKFHIPRGLTHEFVRHRLGSFAQESSRYCGYNKGKFGSEITLIPMNDDLNDAQIERRMRTWKMLEEVYMAEVEEGIKPQQARDNLPICTKSDLIITTNARHWREIFRQRAHKAAHPQMYRIMRCLLADFQGLCSVLFDDIKVS